MRKPRRLDLMVDDPAETGCHGLVLVLGPVRLSVTWPAKDRDEDEQTGLCDHPLDGHTTHGPWCQGDWDR